LTETLTIGNERNDRTQMNTEKRRSFGFFQNQRPSALICVPAKIC
jgi:hypothetical protein